MDFLLNNIWLVLLAVSSGMGIIFLSLQEKIGQTSQYLDINEATNLVNREHAVFVDLRETDVFQQGHIANSKNIPLSTLTETDANISQKVSKLNKTKPIILVCNHGSIAKKGVKVLEKEGFTLVKVLQPGIAGWIKAGLPISANKKD